MVLIKRQISKNKSHFRGTNPRKYITVHQTGNPSKGANAYMHARYIDNGSNATWHYTVDDVLAVQSFEDTVQCFHAGDGAGAGNTQSIGVELCINSDGDYNKTLENGAELISYLMKRHNIPLSNVVQHNKWSGKDCPKQIRQGKNGITWNKFITMIDNKRKGIKTVSKPATNVKTNDINLDDLVRRTIKGEFGNGEERKKKLGSNYKAVQDRINGKVNTVDYDQLVKDTVKGKYGNGEKRKKMLGKYYHEVQRRINKLF